MLFQAFMLFKHPFPFACLWVQKACLSTLNLRESRHALCNLLLIYPFCNSSLRIFLYKGINLEVRECGLSTTHKI